jgi:hypothetical protein
MKFGRTVAIAAPVLALSAVISPRLKPVVADTSAGMAMGIAAGFLGPRS